MSNNGCCYNRLSGESVAIFLAVFAVTIFLKSTGCERKILLLFIAATLTSLCVGMCGVGMCGSTIIERKYLNIFLVDLNGAGNDSICVFNVRFLLLAVIFC